MHGATRLGKVRNEEVRCRVDVNKQNKNTLLRNTGHIETGYNKLRNLYYIMQQLVETNRFINNGNFYKVEF